MSPHASDTAAPCCAVCGAAVPEGAPFGQCPACLIGLAGAAGGAGTGEPVFRDFGDYELLEEVARGGMGGVFRAEQRSLRREVALKMMLCGELSSAAARRMFQIEALAAAALHHPHIVPVYETGEYDLQPFIAMRYVPGRRNIAQWAGGHREVGAWRLLAGSAALVARAVAHAHERGVLHRDLKPSNILWDDEGGPQVADFGLAKIQGATGGGATLTAQMLGSPGYMAPEQAGEGEEVTTATDVYGLGAVVYEMLSGLPPFRGKSALETVRMVREGTPPRLDNVPRELATVCLKCLARRPQDRYDSATALAEELERFSRGEPVQAVPLGVPARLWRWAQRKPAIASLLAVSMAAVIAGVGGIFWQWREAEGARRAQAVALASAESANAAQREAIHHLRWQEMDRLLAAGDPGGALAQAASFLRADPADRGAAMYAMSVVEQHAFPVLAAPEITTLTAKGVVARLAPDARWIVHPAADGTARVFESATGGEVASIRQPRTGGDAAGKVVDFTAIAIGTGDWPLALATGDGQLTLRPLPAGTPARVLCESSRGAVIWELAYTSDGRHLMARTTRDVRVWDLAEPDAPPQTWSLPGGISGSVLSVNGTAVLMWNPLQAAVRDAASGAELMAVEPAEGIAHGAISADGKRIALVDNRHTASVWDVGTGQRMHASTGWKANLVALNADGSRLLAGGHTIPLALYDMNTALPVAHDLWTHETTQDYNGKFPLPQPWMVASADRSTFATTGIESTVLLWDSGTGRMKCGPLRLDSRMDRSFMDLSADGSRVLTHSRVFSGSQPTEARLALWKTTARKLPARHAPQGAAFSIATLNPDGRMAAAGICWPGTSVPCRVLVTDAASGRTVLDAPCPAPASLLLFSPDHKSLHAVLTDAQTVSWSLETGRERWHIGPAEGLVTAADVSPDGRFVVSGSSSAAEEKGALIIQRAEDGEEAGRLEMGQRLSVLRFAPDASGRLLAAGGKGKASIVDAATRTAAGFSRAATRRRLRCGTWTFRMAPPRAGSPSFLSASPSPGWTPGTPQCSCRDGNSGK